MAKNNPVERCLSFSVFYFFEEWMRVDEKNRMFAIITFGETDNWNLSNARWLQVYNKERLATVIGHMQLINRN